MPSVTVVRTYLELESREALRGATIEDSRLRLVRAPAADVGLFRRVYRDVGAAYHWRDRDSLPDEMLRAHFDSPMVQLWVLYHDEQPAGFFELRRHDDTSVEIVYFGLAADFFGRGLGKHLLTCAVDAAWQMGATRVWLHTCTLDAPTALPNYLARGFTPYRTESYEAMLPDEPGPEA